MKEDVSRRMKNGYTGPSAQGRLELSRRRDIG
jgi:hypothetical protein